MKVSLELIGESEEESAVIKAREKTPEIISAMDLLSGNQNKIMVSKDSKTYLLEAGKVYYFESVDKKTFVYTKENCYETKSRLYELEENLGRFFLRCSKAMIVNIKKISSVCPDISGRLIATLLNGEEIVISRSYVKEFKRRLEL